jgi:hypothetical protein
MVREFHLSDEDILRVVDGEMPRRRAAEARAHLAACWECRSRLNELEGTIAAFISLQRGMALPPDHGGRALLKARLADLERSGPRRWRWLTHAQTVAGVCALLLALLVGGTWLVRQSRTHASAYAFSDEATLIPNPEFTPGAVRSIAMREVCSMAHEEVVREVPTSLRDEVFQEYGIVNPRPQDYEIDYLIAPGLGGTQDIHNLWPEPSTTNGWNAHVKDALEERLHELVCDGQLDLPTAQQAIAGNWINAYKKYLGARAGL